MKPNRSKLFVLGVVFALLLAACAAPTPTAYTGERARPAPPEAPRPVSTPAPQSTPVPTLPHEDGHAAAEAGGIEYLLLREVAVPALEQRIIVRTVDIALVVSDVSAAIGQVSSLAVNMGGWVVSSRQAEKYTATISIRVPAARVDDALNTLRSLSARVESEVSTSEDFTDEYIDTEARVRNLQATEKALIRLMEQATKVEDALKVQAELTRVQEDIEKAQGRLSYLGQTSAFSLINVALKQVTMEMNVNAGPDVTVKEKDPVRFQATFTPPEGTTEFVFVWDFGDGSSKVTGTRTAPLEQGSARRTATVTYTYEDGRDSPFIVTVRVTGKGDAGIAEGMDTLIVTVTQIPTIEVFAGDDLIVTEGATVTLSGSFTRPAALSDIKYKWDFGDGAVPSTGGLPAGETTATVTHKYATHRPTPFHAVLTVIGNSEAGHVEGVDEVLVTVERSEPWLGQWRPKETLRAAVWAFSSTVQVLGQLAIWVLVFSPLWGTGVAIAYVWRRRRRRLGFVNSRPVQTPPAGPPPASQMSGSTEAEQEQ